MVEFMLKFIWQHNLPVGSYGTFKMPPGMLDFWCSKGKKWNPPCNSKTKSQRSEPKWLLRSVSSHPTSEPSFSQISWPQLLAPGTLPRTMTLYKVFFCDERRLGIRLRHARGTRGVTRRVSWIFLLPFPWHPARASTWSPIFSHPTHPKKHLNSDWVRVCQLTAKFKMAAKCNPSGATFYIFPIRMW